MYIVLSQDCDVLQISLQKEPVIELIQANRIEQYNAELTAGKNPRQLHMQIETIGHLEFFPSERFFIARHYLENLQATSIAITGRELKILTNWIAKRYIRPGFPDTFNQRVKSINRKLKKIFSANTKNTLGLFLHIQPNKEIKADETYKIRVVMLEDKDVGKDEQESLKISESFDCILRLLSQIEGIQVVEEASQLLSTDDISYHAIKELKQWDFDYLSFLNDEAGETIDNVIV